MQIMSLNGWGGKLYQELLPFLQKNTPDILCLQEVVHSPATDKDWLMYRDGNHILPQRANFYRDVCKALPEHIAVFCPAAQGVLWDEDLQIASQWGLATFVHKSFPIISQLQAFVHKSYAPHGYGAHPRSRSAHAVSVYDYEKDRSISIAHMHGLRDLKGKIDTPERAEQAHKFLSLAQQMTEKDSPAILCGDFNIEPGSETLKILSQAGFTDLVTTRTTKGTRTSHYKKPGRFADYMLVNAQVEVLNFEVIFEPEVSDHCPLVLEV